MRQREYVGARLDGVCPFPGKRQPARKPFPIGILSPAPVSFDPGAAPVASLAPPGSRVAGLTLFVERLSGKRVQPFKEASSFAIMRLVRATR